MNEKKKTDPSSTSLAYDVMAPRWAKINALLGGTEAMRAVGQAFLPMHTEEKQEAYNERLARNVLFNMTELTLDSWVGRPFGERIIQSEDMPPELKTLMDDVDLQGNNVDVFARQWFRDGLAKAFSHVLVDFPRPEPMPNGKPRTLADDRNEMLRPYWVNIPPENVIFMHSEVAGGVEYLTHVRIREDIITMDGFTEIVTPRIRVLTPGMAQIYEQRRIKSGRTEWVPIDEYSYDLNFIPMVTFYANREGLALGKSPLTDLGDLNIAHWQSQSDQTAILTVARFPMLALSGGVDEKKELKVGPHQWLFTPDSQGRFYYVEHTGKAIGAGRQDLLDLEEKMAQYGAEFLKKDPDRMTATAKALNHIEATSPLQDVVVRFNDSLNLALDYMAQWMKLTSTGSLRVNTDFGPDELDSSNLDALKVARQGRDISRETYLKELKRRHVLAEDFDPEEDEEELEEEASAINGEAEMDLDEGGNA